MMLNVTFASSADTSDKESVFKKELSKYVAALVCIHLSENTNKSEKNQQSNCIGFRSCSTWVDGHCTTIKKVNN